MERLENVRSWILLLLPLCILSAVAAFLLPTYGTIFTCATVALALIIGALCLMGLWQMDRHDRSST